MTEHNCPICNSKLEEAPWVGNAGSQEICPSCGVQFGYSDHAGGDRYKRQEIYTMWKDVWIQNDKNPLNKEQIVDLIAKVFAK